MTELPCFFVKWTNQDTSLLCFYLNALTVHTVSGLLSCWDTFAYVLMREGGNKKPCLDQKWVKCFHSRSRSLISALSPASKMSHR